MEKNNLELICHTYDITNENIITKDNSQGKSWHEVAEKLYYINTEIKQYETEKKYLRDKLILLSNNQTKTNMCYVFECLKSLGSINYIEMAKTHNIDINLYRKEPINRWILKKL